MTDDLMAFLRERLDEDEQNMRNGYLTAEPLPDYHGWDQSTTAGLPPAVAVRVLAEIDAKRQLVTIFVECREPSDVEGIGWDGGWYAALTYALRLAALPYRVHPDYLPEWAPDA